MDQQPPLPELRPLAMGELFDGAMSITVRSYAFLLPLTALVLAPFELLAAFLTRSKSADPSQVSAPDVTIWERVAGAAVLQFSALIVTAVVVLVAVDVLLERAEEPGRIATAGSREAGRAPKHSGGAQPQCHGRGRRRALARGLKRLPALIGYFIVSLLVMGVPVGVGLGLARISGRHHLGVAGIIGALMVAAMVVWLAVSLVPGASALLVEGDGPLRAVARAFVLSRGQWRRCLLVFVVATLVAQLLTTVLGFTIESILAGLGGENGDFRFVWSAIGATFASAAVAPFPAAAALVLYLDLRVRREAFDHAALARQKGTSK